MSAAHEMSVFQKSKPVVHKNITSAARVCGLQQIVTYACSAGFLVFQIGACVCDILLQPADRFCRL